VITFAAGPTDEASGDGEVNAILGDGFGESDPTLAGLLAAAAEGKALTGVSPAWASAKAYTNYDLSAQQCPTRSDEASGALLSRMAALIPPPRRPMFHRLATVYAGVLSSRSKWRQWIVPNPKAEPLNPGQKNFGLETTPDLAFKQEAIETKSKVGRAVETTA